MKPTIGRIVIFNTTEAQQEQMQSLQSTGMNVQKQVPAIIVAVWSDTCVNLKLILDGNTACMSEWVTSATQGDQSNNWNWPVKSE